MITLNDLAIKTLIPRPIPAGITNQTLISKQYIPKYSNVFFNFSNYKPFDYHNLVR